MAIDLSKFILSANNSGGQRLTPSEQLGLAYKQQNQFAESSTRAYQQAMAQGSAAAIPLAFAMGLERRRANEALGRYNQAITKEAEDRDMMMQQFAANLPEKQQGLFANLSPENQDKVATEILKSQFTSKPPKTQVIKTDSGFFNYNPTDGTTTPITGPDGNQLQVPQKKGDQTNIYNMPAKLNPVDQKRLGEVYEQAEAADSTIADINELILLNEEIETGPGANLAAKGAEFVDAVTLGTVSSPSMTKYQRFEALSTGLGAKALQLFGGNDSNRELLVALGTTASPKKTNAANKAILERKKIAAEILSDRPGFLTQWVNDNGSIARLNPKGQSFASAWQNYQKQKWSELTRGVGPANLSKNERASVLGDVKRFLKAKPKRSRREELEGKSNEELLRLLNS